MKTFEQWIIERGLRTSLSGNYPPSYGGAGQNGIGYAMATSPKALPYYLNREKEEKRDKKKKKRKKHKKRKHKR